MERHLPPDYYPPAQKPIPDSKRTRGNTVATAATKILKGQNRRSGVWSQRRS